MLQKILYCTKNCMKSFLPILDHLLYIDPRRVQKRDVGQLGSNLLSMVLKDIAANKNV